MKLILSAALTLLTATAANAQFVQEPLPYSYSALEPAIDRQTMEIHYTKHHATYVKNLNASLADNDDKSLSAEDLMGRISLHNASVRNNGGGHYNHSFFWKIMTPGGSKPSPAMTKRIEDAFGSMDRFKDIFADSAAKRFGSGWAWLIVQNGKLMITTTANQDNPLMNNGVSERGTPILGLDVWEHAYYLKYQNKRPEYIKAWFSVVNWKEVERRWEEADKLKVKY